MLFFLSLLFLSFDEEDDDKCDDDDDDDENDDKDDDSMYDEEYFLHQFITLEWTKVFAMREEWIKFNIL